MIWCSHQRFKCLFLSCSCCQWPFSSSSKVCRGAVAWSCLKVWLWTTLSTSTRPPRYEHWGNTQPVDSRVKHCRLCVCVYKLCVCVYILCVCVRVYVLYQDRSSYCSLWGRLSVVIINGYRVFLCLQHHRAAELCRFCEGFFLQNMDQLLDREDFHRLLLGGVGQELFCSGKDPAVLLRDLEAVLTNRLYTLNAACRE